MAAWGWIGGEHGWGPWAFATAIGVAYPRRGKEDDDERMARGHRARTSTRPPTLYGPVVAFYCHHLTGTMVNRPTVVVRSLGEANGMTEQARFRPCKRTGGMPPARRAYPGSRRPGEGANSSVGYNLKSIRASLGIDAPGNPSSRRSARRLCRLPFIDADRIAGCLFAALEDTWPRRCKD